jgi:hypothetical protein
MTISTALYNLTAVATGGDVDVAAGGGRLMAILLEGGSDASWVDIFNSDHEHGTAVVTVSAGTALTQYYDFTEIGGIAFDTGMYVIPLGTGAICYLWTG